MKSIKVVVKKVKKVAQVKNIVSNNYLEEFEEFKNIVDGWVEQVHFFENVYIICNENGRIIELPHNVHNLFGNILFVGLKYDKQNDDYVYCSLTDKQILFIEDWCKKKY